MGVAKKTVRRVDFRSLSTLLTLAEYLSRLVLLMFLVSANVLEFDLPVTGLGKLN